MHRALVIPVCVVIAVLVLAGCGAAEPVVVPEGAVLIDVRTAAEFADWHAPQAVNLPHDRIADTIAGQVPDKATPIAVYCRSGNRSGQAQASLQRLGYTQVVNIGGLSEVRAWLAQSAVPVP
ncbi:MAG: rhodanese-like domain-containing protein [Planctomycetota bacterium]|jgi:phage shock protein E|nr:rhodanese-like domain-containing protein [Planctomycetota bacterium]